jgi:hypothetical protein
MCELVENMMFQDRKDRQSKINFTILKREGGVWHGIEVNRLVNNLVTEVYSHPKHPEYIYLYGHYTKAQALEAIIGGFAFTAEKVTGVDRLLWNPF